MNERNYKKRLEFQKNMISSQSQQIESLKSENEKLKQKLKEKDTIIASVEPMRKELAENVEEYKRLKSEYNSLIQELKQMKHIFNKDVFRGKWKIVRWLIKL